MYVCMYYINYTKIRKETKNFTLCLFVCFCVEVEFQSFTAFQLHSSNSLSLFPPLSLYLSLSCLFYNYISTYLTLLLFLWLLKFATFVCFVFPFESKANFMAHVFVNSCVLSFSLVLRKFQRHSVVRCIFHSHSYVFSFSYWETCFNFLYRQKQLYYYMLILKYILIYQLLLLAILAVSVCVLSSIFFCLDL